jgi:hypothetical protein
MQSRPIVSCVEEIAGHATVRISTIRCYMHPGLTANSRLPSFSPDRELAAQAMTLLRDIDAELREARADWNQDRFRRLMLVRQRAVTRLRRRWAVLNPSPRIPLGSLRRRYHANLAGHLYDPSS